MAWGSSYLESAGDQEAVARGMPGEPEENMATEAKEVVCCTKKLVIQQKQNLFFCKTGKIQTFWKTNQKSRGKAQIDKGGNGSNDY